MRRAIGAPAATRHPAQPTPIPQAVQGPKQGGSELVAMGDLHYTAAPHRHSAPVDAVVQRVRAVNESEWPKLDVIHGALEHYDDVLSHSSSIPPRLPEEFFELYARAEAEYWEIHDREQVQDEDSIGTLEGMIGALDGMMNAAKRRAAIDRSALVPGMDRPPSKQSRYMPDNVKSRAMERAQALNADLNALVGFERNLAVLKSNPKATFYVMGKSAMGQGDTAFVVRAVSMLQRLGLRAVGVKAEKEAHSGGTSFSSSLAFITPEQMRALAGPGDFIIEGPLSDPVLPPLGSKVVASTISTEFDAMGGFTADKRGIRNLRLYEYGTLTYRGGQAVQSESASNVVHYADRVRHGFMGMGHGEMGAFYNAGDTRVSQPLEHVLSVHAEKNRASAELLHLLDEQPDAEIYVGYANKRDSVKGWVTAVSALAALRPKFVIVVGLYGELRHAEAVPIEGADTTYVRSKGDYSGAHQSATVVPGKSSRSVVLIADGVPAPVMAALQKRAMPFTLSTGNYSLSEAVENNHFPIYETLDFNAGVESALRFQVENALTKTGLKDTEFGRAALELSKSGPESIRKKTKEIAIVLAHPYEIRLVMGVIRANTDVKENLVARLAALAMD